MATSHQPSFEIGFVLPITERKPVEAARVEQIPLDSILDTAFEEISQWKQVNSVKRSSRVLDARWKAAAERINEAAIALQKPTPGQSPAGNTSKLISENLSMIRLALLECRAGIQNAQKLPHVQAPDTEEAMPRSLALASLYLRTSGYYFSQPGFLRFITAVQEQTPLLLSEIWNLKAFLELELLEQIAAQISHLGGSGHLAPATANSLHGSAIHSLSRVTTLEWKAFFQNVSLVESILRTDPAGAYEQMDYESRDAYRAAVVEIAAHSDCTEAEVADKAISLAMAARQSASGATRARDRRSHVGFYLVDRGRTALAKLVGYRAPILTRPRDLVLKWSDLFYLLSIELITFAVMALVIKWLHVTALGLLPIALLVLPAVECAVAAVNLMATRLFPPRKLSKLDFSKGIPSECATVVAVPTLLSSVEQVQQAVRALEVRFLANRDPYLRFALVTDLPDSPQQFDEKDALVGLCSELIQKLNAKYGPENRGAFFHFHRRRIFNAAEGVWMGWERKRGKLLEFNRFLLKQADAFPVKIGDLSLLDGIRYVITLDLDTQLPPGVAHRLVGSLAHPLNRAVVNSRTNTVVEGYGVLQPRVDIDLKSTQRSWFAKLLSGDTGVDIYTRAVSDVYQDLFGQGIFTGKGIYEVETFQRVLEQRFPNNLVLSHDLIEGEYVRAGLLSDVEVVDDYPSHYSAFSRRKHRWIRGDWQVLFGLSRRIPDASGQPLPNPLNHISRWKIIDNLRRSVTECATLVVLLYGWLVLPEAAWRWTIAAAAILLFPTYFPLAVSLVTAGKAWFRADFWKSWWADFALATCRVFVRLAFLCHQSFIDADAIVRSLIRMKITHKRLLQWETAADAEAAHGHGLVDFCLKCSMGLTIAVALIMFAFRPHLLVLAAPFLFLWGTALWTGQWLNQAPRRRSGVLKPEDRKIVRGIALRTWRFFREFSSARENWLIPDIVQQNPPLMAHRVSPTNLGLLLNSRLAAHDLGFLTTTEFIQDTEATLGAVERMPKSKGHLYNWYENSTLEPVAPLFVSTVDNGNFLCSLWTLKHGCLEILKQPLLRPIMWETIVDHVDVLVDLARQDDVDESFCDAVLHLKTSAQELIPGGLDRLNGLRAFASEVMRVRYMLATCKVPVDVSWWTKELTLRVAGLLQILDNLLPWLDSRYEPAAAISEAAAKRLASELSLESLPELYTELCRGLDCASTNSDPTQSAAEPPALLRAMQHSIRYAQEIKNRLNAIANAATKMADEMDFSLLYDQKKKLFSIGLEFENGQPVISKYNYDLLASEARTAVFAAIAKGEIPQETWFQLKRSYRAYKGEDVLLSWSGTTFEYLMPCLWTKAYTSTLLERGVRAAIRAQQKFAKQNRVSCWGISESSCNQRNPDGHYRYHAFGVPPLSLHSDDCTGDVVIAPYATFLALPFETAASMKNLRKMQELGWVSPYGFYEAADFTPRRVNDGQSHEIVRNWMAHHQGMCMVAAANVLCDSAMQRRFHADARVAATERLLQEKLPRAIPYEEETETISKSAPALLRLALRPHPGFRGLLPKLLLKGENYNQPAGL